MLAGLKRCADAVGAGLFAALVAVNLWRCWRLLRHEAEVEKA